VTDRFYPLPLQKLLELTLSGIRKKMFFGIPGSLFHIPALDDPFRMTRYGVLLETPLGLAAGPHTQLAQNIIAGWLCGARYIELKTVQTLDELQVSKPCIDMRDEGYNCEWSQELKLRQSLDEYLNAWILIHILRKELGFTGPVGTIFNMSVGYNLEGILQPNVQEFYLGMKDSSEKLREKTESIRGIYPAIQEIEIPSRISDNITLSTMHGCPPDEIEKIGLYLIQEKKLHTTIKLNPTLLGAEEVRKIVNSSSGFATGIPDIAFEHDVKYEDALGIISSLQKASDDAGLHFSIKLTNTLESVNNKDIFSRDEKMMYMSGRALHPISIRLARKLRRDLPGRPDISFSAGTDCFNIADILSCGLKPVTVCSDLLKPGGYGRLWQYIDNLRASFAEVNATNTDEFILSKARGNSNITDAAYHNLDAYAEKVSDNKAYRKTAFTDPDIKTTRQLGPFDCIHAPCTDTCPTNQDIPRYLHFTSEGDISSAFHTIFDTNPFPTVTGMVCDHPCQLKCTRINYDEALRIREIKRFVAENHNGDVHPVKIKSNGLKAAIIGGGPAGLSCAWFLNLAGFEVHVFEQKTKTGGMVSAAIPSFRLTDKKIGRDVDRIISAGVEIHRSTIVNKDNFSSIRQTHDIVFIATGAQESSKLMIEGTGTRGVLDPLAFLYNIRDGKPSGQGKNVVIIGGGNTAMDAARTAFRMVGKNGRVTLVYRRTIREMPADKGEIEAVMQEGIGIIELTNPEKIIASEGKVSALICSKNKMASRGIDGRLSPVKMEGSEFEVACDTVIPAIGQQLAIDFAVPALLKTERNSYRTRLKGVYIGGDAMRGASTAINAIADGRKAAAEIMIDLGIHLSHDKIKPEKKPDLERLLHHKAIRKAAISPAETPTGERKNFNLVIGSLSPGEAREEASRCLQCDEICNVCVSVCPNLANFSYTIEPVKYSLRKAKQDETGLISFEEDGEFVILQKHQVFNIRDFCNECGNCTAFCPTSGRPFRDKPGLCLTEESFNAEPDAYILRNGNVLVSKINNDLEKLIAEEDHYIYETKDARIKISKTDFRIADAEFLSAGKKETGLVHAAEMSIILNGALQLGYR
jgi:putative selenate reductase